MYYKKVRNNFTSYNMIFINLKKAYQNPKFFNRKKKRRIVSGN